MDKLCCIVNTAYRCNDCKARLCSAHASQTFSVGPFTDLYWCEDCGDKHVDCVEEIEKSQKKIDLLEEALGDWEEVANHGCQTCAEGEEPCERLISLIDTASQTHDGVSREIRRL